jgi:hypothetical protein
MSKKCYIEVKDKGANNVTVKVYGDGKQVKRVDKPLPKGDVLTIGGDAKDNNAFIGHGASTLCHLIQRRKISGGLAQYPIWRSARGPFALD